MVVPNLSEQQSRISYGGIAFIVNIVPVVMVANTTRSRNCGCSFSSVEWLVRIIKILALGGSSNRGKRKNK